MKSLQILVIALMLALSSQVARALTVGFINPGRSDEAYWVAAAQAMQAAALSLNIKLEMHFAEREPTRALAIAQEIAARPKSLRPDYVILVNEKGTLVSNAQTLGAAGIKTFAAFNGLLVQERAAWAPRSGLPLLLGSLEPRARDAGYLTAKALIAQGFGAGMQPSGAKLQMLAIAGDRSTPNSIQRNEGMRQAVAEDPRVELKEQVFADWRRDLAAEKMRGLHLRHPQAQLLWTASDQMAFGAIEVLEQNGVTPGKDKLVATINTSNEAMQALISGRLSALAGGHFMTGAWALVMLYDYHQGHDFAAEGLELERPMFMLFGKTEARRFLARFGERGVKLDFKPFSKHHNPALKTYQFKLDALLH
jgi:ABC-type sugar transport system substrate-binding protein